MRNPLCFLVLKLFNETRENWWAFFFAISHLRLLNIFCKKLYNFSLGLNFICFLTVVKNSERFQRNARLTVGDLIWSWIINKGGNLEGGLKRQPYSAFSREVVGKNVHTTIPKSNVGIWSIHCSWHCSCRTYFCCFPLALANIRSMGSCAILSTSFEEQWTQNHPQYVSGLSRELFPTTFLEIAVFIRANSHTRYQSTCGSFYLPSFPTTSLPLKCKLWWLPHKWTYGDINFH